MIKISKKIALLMLLAVTPMTVMYGMEGEGSGGGGGHEAGQTGFFSRARAWVGDKAKGAWGSIKDASGKAYESIKAAPKRAWESTQDYAKRLSRSRSKYLEGLSEEQKQQILLEEFGAKNIAKIIAVSFLIKDIQPFNDIVVNLLKNAIPNTTEIVTPLLKSKAYGIFDQLGGGRNILGLKNNKSVLKELEKLGFSAEEVNKTDLMRISTINLKKLVVLSLSDDTRISMPAHRALNYISEAFIGHPMDGNLLCRIAREYGSQIKAALTAAGLAAAGYLGFKK